MSKSFPSIPEPTSNPDSVLTSVRALKQAVELLIGTRGNVAPTRCFVQGDAPSAERAGDIWINTANNNKALVWDGTDWRALTV